MTGWIVAAFAVGYMARAATVMAWGVWLSRRNLRKMGEAVKTIPMR